LKFTEVVALNNVGENIVESVKGWYPGVQIAPLISPYCDIVDNGDYVVVVS
jgi:hypothetical protein